MKVLMTILTAFLFLTACNKTTVNKEAVTTSVGTTTVEEKTQTRVFRYTTKVDNKQQAIEESVTYKGKTFERLTLKVTQAFDEATKKNLETQDFEAFKTQMATKIAEQDNMKKLTGTKGVTWNFDMDMKSGIILTIAIDMQTVDWKSLGEIQGIELNPEDLKDNTPEDYIALLLQKGAVEVSSSGETTTQVVTSQEHSTTSTIKE